MVYPWLRDEFRLRMLGFRGVRGDRFCTSQWRMPVLVYLLYRCLLMCYGVFWLGFVSYHRGGATGHAPASVTMQAWGAYLTVWTYVLLNIYLVVHFLAACGHHASILYQRSGSVSVSAYLCSRPNATSHARMFPEFGRSVVSVDGYEAIRGNGEEERDMEALLRPPWYLCVVWIMFNVVSAAAVMVSIVFFTFLFHTLSDYPKISLENLQEHLLNSVIVVVEHLVSAAPYRLLHVVYPLVYGVIYMTFSLFYWAADHDHVMYPILDWNKPGATVGYVFMVGFGFIPLLHIVFFAVHKAKMAVYRRLSCTNGDL